ncbi:metal-dependent hydrolase [Haladaptatus sp. NG-WS-4]
MWPWEHVAFGYLWYSLSVNLARRPSPRTREVVVLGFAALLPDLVDKPLSWSFELFPTGYSVAHSVFVAGLVLSIIATFAWCGRRLRYAAAFGVGYVSHLVGDIVYPVFMGEGLKPEVVLWPVVQLAAYEQHRGLTGRFLLYFFEYLQMLGEAGWHPIVVFELVLGTAMFALWLYDGTAGLPTPDWRKR